MIQHEEGAGRAATTGPGRVRLLALLAAASLIPLSPAGAQRVPEVERLEGNPIIRPSMLPGRDGANIAGPSLVRAPEWLAEPLGRYYLYFAHHEGRYIRLAYADALTGPWTVHEPGTLRLEQTRCNDLPDPDMVSYMHVASPDVHVDADERRIRMYFHCNVFLGGDPGSRDRYPQVTLVATSGDGVHFDARREVLGRPYFRVVRWRGWHYALGMPGVFYRSRDPLSGFERGPTLFTRDMRHSALMVRDDRLLVFYTVVGQNPERILLSEIDLGRDWMEWEESEPVVVLEPEAEWEGADLPAEPSTRGAADGPVRQLRDPALFHEAGRTYLLYSVAGEQGIAIARLRWDGK